MAICGVASGLNLCVSRSTASNSLKTFVPRPLMAELPVPSEQITMRFAIASLPHSCRVLCRDLDTSLLNAGQHLPDGRNRRGERRDIADPRIDELLLREQQQTRKPERNGHSG